MRLTPLMDPYVHYAQVSACKALIVLAGDTYRHRLWCIMEIFCFLAMGGSVGDIILLDVRRRAARDGPGINIVSHGKEQSQPSMRARGGSFRVLWRSNRWGTAEEEINIEAASCNIPEERDRMLGVIEAAYGDLFLFEDSLQDLFSSTRSSRRWSQEAYSGNVWRNTTDNARRSRGASGRNKPMHRANTSWWLHRHFEQQRSLESGRVESQRQP
eukprot:scaffold48222_cov30-Tisochrysis_lutea.AAC.4